MGKADSIIHDLSQLYLGIVHLFSSRQTEKLPGKQLPVFLCGVSKDEALILPQGLSEAAEGVIPAGRIQRQERVAGM